MLIKKHVSLDKKATFQMRWLEVKTTDEGRIRIKGFASTPQIDRYDDIVNPAAFANAMTQYMQNPVVLLGHNPDKVLGKVIEYNLSNDGLEILAELSNDIDNTFHNIMEKNLRGFSIGFICKSYQTMEKNDREIREIIELDLVEISVVSTPANPSSLFSLSKSLKALFSELEQKEAEGEQEHTPEQEQEQGNEEQKEAEGNEEKETPEGKPEETQEEEKGKAPCTKCGKMHDGECEDETEEASKDDTNQKSKTEKEAKSGESPETPEQVDDPAQDKQDEVKDLESTEEKPDKKGISEDEVKSLIELAVKQAVEPLIAEIEALKASHEDNMKSIEMIASEYSNLEDSQKTLEKSHKQLEKDVLKIEVRPNTATKSTAPATPVVVTDAMVLKSLGY